MLTISRNYLDAAPCFVSGQTDGAQWVAIGYSVGRISFPGARHRIDGLFPGYPGSFARRPTVASAADSAFLWVQTQYHSHAEFHFRRAFIS
jgi:hypothetical protein